MFFNLCILRRRVYIIRYLHTEASKLVAHHMAFKLYLDKYCLRLFWQCRVIAMLVS